MAGRKHALLIDAGFASLEASAASTERVAAGLERHGFTDRVVLAGERATIAEIQAHLAGLKLVDGDALVVYFVGHGEVVRDPRSAGDPECVGAIDVFVLITRDILDPAAEAAGVSGLELVRWLLPHAAATDNVTVILDCCHAASLVPGQAEGGVRDVRVQAAIDAATGVLRQRYARLRRRLRSAEETDADETPTSRTVHLVATTADEFAEEGLSRDRTRQIGLFSDAVADALLHASAAAWTWEDHIVGVQRRVLARCRTQRPGVEGPRHRLPFTTTTRAPDGSHPCQRDEDNRFVLHAGTIHGVDVGDVFEIVQAGRRERRVATAKVTAVGIARAALDANFARAGLRAIPVRRMRPTVVALAADRGDSAALVRVTTPGRLGIVFVEPGQAADAVLELRDEAATLQTCDGLVLEAAALDGAGLRRLVAALARIAHHRRVDRGLRELEAAGAHSGVPELTVTWGRGDQVLAARGAMLARSDSVWIGAEPHSHGALHVAVFHVRADRSVVDLMPELDHGRTILRGRVTELRQTAAGLRDPWPLRGARAHAAAVRESLVVVASPVPLSLHGLATPRVVRGERSGPPGSCRPPAIVRLEFLVAPADGDPAS